MGAASIPGRCRASVGRPADLSTPAHARWWGAQPRWDRGRSALVLRRDVLVGGRASRDWLSPFERKVETCIGSVRDISSTHRESRRRCAASITEQGASHEEPHRIRIHPASARSRPRSWTGGLRRRRGAARWAARLRPAAVGRPDVRPPVRAAPAAGGGRRPRVRRGDVRSAILDVLARLATEPINGYQVIQQIAERTDGAWKPSPGSVYPTIAQLQDEGLVEDAPAGRKALQLTDEGRALRRGARRRDGGRLGAVRRGGRATTRRPTSSR